uniref:Uncharacterized protein n=1 Tax=Panagrolaimus sp. ES5 TaxID=591445 RepID=A0AC34F0M1_9BILA
MSSDNTNAEKDYYKFVRSFIQYANPNKPIKDLASIKPEIIEILKTHRPIRFVDYQFGISKSLKLRTQIIVHECNERLKVREYFKVGVNAWKCCECNRINSNETDNNDLILAHGMVFVKNGHDCKPREISFVQKIQKLYKEKNVEEAVALQKSVLGSEDLNVVCKQKTDANKRGTKAPKIAKETSSEIRLKYAPGSTESVEEPLSSNMDESVDKIQIQILSPEAAFADIIENLQDYTTEKAEVVLSNKGKILSALKTHRPIITVNYKFGLIQNLRRNQRLIVFEWNDRKRVREYSHKIDRKNLWVCRECFRINNRKNLYGYFFLYYICDIAFVPYNHYCKPKDYELVMQYQKFLADGDTTKARGMVRTVNFHYGENSFANIVNVLDTVSASIPDPSLTDEPKDDNENNSKTLTNLKRKIESDNGNGSSLACEKPLPLKKSKRNKNKKNSVGEECDHFINRNSQISIGKEEESVATTSTFLFEKPSTLMLEEICSKLDIEYCSRAEKLWNQIIFKQIDTVVLPKKILIHHLKMKNIYEILSKFFTGKVNHSEQIKSTIIDAFRNKLVSAGVLSTKNFNKMYLDTVTEKLLSFIAKFLSCRILVFDGVEIRKYGNWKNTSSQRVTLVVVLINGFYSIVLDF